jgi:hypothetical protein
MIEGWDDAPFAKVYASLEPKSVTFIYPYYCNAQFLRRQMDGWIAYPETIRRHLSAIIVDDGSPESQAEVTLKRLPKPFQIRLFYIEVDVRWNWLAARNIAMKHAPEGWCAATDMDHVIPLETAEALVWGTHDPACIYRFSRVEHTGQQIHSHPNSWFMTREMFWRFGGYDEALSGLYGTDGEARRRWVKTTSVLTLKEKLIRHEYVGDSSTTKYKRKQKEDAAVASTIKGRGKNWKPKVLSFPFHEVML